MLKEFGGGWGDVLTEFFLERGMCLKIFFGGDVLKKLRGGDVLNGFEGG